jgi:hypothetical protein
MNFTPALLFLVHVTVYYCRIQKKACEGKVDDVSSHGEDNGESGPRHRGRRAASSFAEPRFPPEPRFV